MHGDISNRRIQETVKKHEQQKLSKSKKSTLDADGSNVKIKGDVTGLTTRTDVKYESSIPENENIFAQKTMLDRIKT